MLRNPYGKPMIVALLKTLIAIDTMYYGSYFGVTKIYLFPDRKLKKKI